MIPVRPPTIPGQAPQHLPPPLAGESGPSQLYGGITYYSPEQQLGFMKKPPSKRQANPIPIEQPPEVSVWLML